MDNFNYTCGYCGKNYIPKRRKIQKYCSASCRTRACNIRKSASLNKPIENSNTNNYSNLNKIDKMSWAGVGNAAAGTLAVNALSNILTREENKPATKKDIKEIKALLSKRYHEVLNMDLDGYGNEPFYDMETKTIVYLKRENYGKYN